MSQNFSSFPMVLRQLVAFFVSVVTILIGGAAWGHGVNLFATVEGIQIRGTLKYADGTRITSAPIQAFAPDGATLAEVHTDEAGRFEITAQYRCAYRLVGDAGEGHRGTYTIPATELPDTLPEWSGEDRVGAANGEEVNPTPNAAEEVEPVPNVAVESPDDTHAPTDWDVRMEKAIARQIVPLREQLHDYEKQIRLRDFLGGVGYVFGLMGLVILLKRRRGRSDG